MRDELGPDTEPRARDAEGAGTAGEVEQEPADDRDVFEELRLLRLAGRLGKTPVAVADQRRDDRERDKLEGRQPRSNAEHQGYRSDDLGGGADEGEHLRVRHAFRGQGGGETR